MPTVEVVEKLTFEERFIKENVNAKFEVNAYTLYNAYLKYLKSHGSNIHKDPILHYDYDLLDHAGIPDSFKFLDLCILAMNNGYVVVGTSSPADVSGYVRNIGMEWAVKDAVSQGAALKAFEFKSKVADGFKIPSDVTIRQSSAHFSEDVYYWQLNLGAALMTMDGLENTPVVLFNTDICTVIMDNDFMMVGSSQVNSTENYKALDNRNHARAAAFAKMVPMVRYLSMGTE